MRIRSIPATFIVNDCAYEGYDIEFFENINEKDKENIKGKVGWGSVVDSWNKASQFIDAVQSRGVISTVLDYAGIDNSGGDRVSDEIYNSGTCLECYDNCAICVDGKCFDEVLFHDCKNCNICCFTKNDDCFDDFAKNLNPNDSKNEKLNFGFGTLLGSVGYLNNSKGFGGLHWGMVTYGDRKNNVTLSLGYSYLNTQERTTSYVKTPGTYPVSYYNVNTGVGYVSSPYEVIESVVPLIKGPTIGLAGIRSIGKKASFVFDMMFNYSQRITPTQSIEFINFDPITNIPTSGIVGPVGSDSNVSTFINFMIMPGMRFQKNENKAFQVSLAGIIGSETKSYKKEHSFPFPMCTWFYKF